MSEKPKLLADLFHIPPVASKINIFKYITSKLPFIEIVALRPLSIEIPKEQISKYITEIFSEICSTSDILVADDHTESKLSEYVDYMRSNFEFTDIVLYGNKVQYFDEITIYGFPTKFSFATTPKNIIVYFDYNEKGQISFGVDIKDSTKTKSLEKIPIAAQLLQPKKSSNKPPSELLKNPINLTSKKPLF
jgi:hypothetical protein